MTASAVVTTSIPSSPSTRNYFNNTNTSRSSELSVSTSAEGHHLRTSVPGNSPEFPSSLSSLSFTGPNVTFTKKHYVDSARHDAIVSNVTTTARMQSVPGIVSSAPSQQDTAQLATATTTTIPLHSSKTTATIITNSKRPTIIIYPTVSPESIVIPIVSCILGFPLLALLVICCLRRRAKLARERDRRRNYDMQDHAVSLVRFSPIHRLNNRSSRAISLRPERSLSRGFPSLELDTVIEERSDAEQTQIDILSPESPLDPQKYRDFNSS